MRQYYVYILANLSRRLYIGVTSDLLGRVYKHKQGAFPGFTKTYRITNLVYFEATPNVSAAIAREKQIKRWTRVRKYRLIDRHNAGWRDLSVDW
jgi:putative endonuclease